LEFLSDYYFDINHIKDKENKVVDALSRRVHEMHSIAIIMYKSDLKEKKIGSYKIKPTLCANKRNITTR